MRNITLIIAGAIVAFLFGWLIVEITKPTSQNYEESAPLSE